MGYITPVQFNYAVDKLTASALALIGTSGSGFGTGSWALSDSADYGSSRKMRDYLTGLQKFSDYDQTSLLGAATQKLMQNVGSTKGSLFFESMLPSQYSGWLNSLNSDCAAAGAGAPLVGVNGLDTFAYSYYGAGSGGPWKCMYPPDFATIYAAVFPGNSISAANVFSPTIANMAQWVVSGAGTGAFTAGTAVNTALYGGTPRPQIVVTGITGTGVVTVTGTNQAGVTGHTWTFTVPGNGTYDLAPTVSTDMLVSVQSIAAAAGITAGTIVVKAALPYMVANMGQQVISGSFTAGTSFPPGADDPIVKMTGFTGSSDTVTVTGLNQNSVPGSTWTATVNANGFFALTPGVGGDRPTVITAIAAGASISAGTIVAACRRMNPPV